jgi:hypothetical protein
LMLTPPVTGALGVIGFIDKASLTLLKLYSKNIPVVI